MTTECELKLLAARATGLRLSIEENEAEVEKHKKRAFESRKLLQKTLKEMEEKKESCKCMNEQ